MEISRSIKKEFVPVTIVLTTQEEVNALYQVGNYSCSIAGIITPAGATGRTEDVLIQLRAQLQPFKED